MRRATGLQADHADANGISIHALREESDWGTCASNDCDFTISIHALREESDTFCMVLSFSIRFQSTLSVRRATRQRQVHRQWNTISIHALREESDPCFKRFIVLLHISIHALREESDLA